MAPLDNPLRRVYWETTASCNLRCLHCRRQDILYRASPDELTTAEAFDLVNQMSSLGPPVLILSGGEPLFRRDILEIASFAKSRGLPVGIATNGTLVNKDLALRMRQSGIHYASISLDGARAATHDSFRGRGNFERAIRGALFLKNAGLKIQINFTVTKKNISELPDVYQMAKGLNAYALYLFLLVPVGCGVQIAASQMLSPNQVEDWLKWVVTKNAEGPLPIKTICAPQYYRIESEMDIPEITKSTTGYTSPHANEPAFASSLKTEDRRKGCLAGVHMCFISHEGDVFPCGYMPVSCGNIRRQSLKKIWGQSKILNDLRRPDLLEGRCGSCSFQVLCGGCRARAYHEFGNYLQEEPFCVYKPAAMA
ncbi:MAG: radical SAM protein [Elusimicrobia bacterium]|nr:radical SAM protein [Elusimicrobiota bacterium]